jgi:hypothetical protein
VLNANQKDFPVPADVYVIERTVEDVRTLDLAKRGATVDDEFQPNLSDYLREHWETPVKFEDRSGAERSFTPAEANQHWDITDFVPELVSWLPDGLWVSWGFGPEPKVLSEPEAIQLLLDHGKTPPDCDWLQALKTNRYQPREALMKTSRKRFCLMVPGARFGHQSARKKGISRGKLRKLSLKASNPKRSMKPFIVIQTESGLSAPFMRVLLVLVGSRSVEFPVKRPLAG